MKVFLKVVLVVGLAFSLLLLSCIATLWLGSKLLFPSRDTDEEMIDFFQANREQFEDLAVRMMNENELRVIFPDSGSCQIDEGVLISAASHPRCMGFVEDFRQLGLHWAYTGAPPIWLSTHASGLGISGSSKGFYYSTEPPHELVPNTDTAPFVNGYIDVFRQIDDNWYIFYMVN
jgi:hypothetical protein